MITFKIWDSKEKVYIEETFSSYYEADEHRDELLEESFYSALDYQVHKFENDKFVGEQLSGS